jgi:hypothetical protein
MKKLGMTTLVFLTKMHHIADELATARRPVPGDEHGSRIIKSFEVWQCHSYRKQLM